MARSYIPRLLSSNVHTTRRPENASSGAVMSVKRSVDEGFVDVGVSSGRAFAFRLNLLPDYTDFRSLFDEYKIDKLVFHIVNVSNDILPNSTGPPTNPGMCFYAVDYDDAGTPTSKNYMLQYDNCKYLLPSQSAHVSFVPKVILDTEGNGGMTTGVTLGSAWVNVGTGIVNHYGLKMWLDGGNGPQIYQWRCIVDYYITFRKAR